MTPDQTIEMLSSLAAIANMLDRLSWTMIIFVIIFIVCSFLRSIAAK